MRGFPQYKALEVGWSSKIHVLLDRDIATEAEKSAKINNILKENYLTKTVCYPELATIKWISIARN